MLTNFWILFVLLSSKFDVSFINPPKKRGWLLIPAEKRWCASRLWSCPCMQSVRNRRIDSNFIIPTILGFSRHSFGNECSSLRINKSALITESALCARVLRLVYLLVMVWFSCQIQSMGSSLVIRFWCRYSVNYKFIMGSLSELFQISTLRWHLGKKFFCEWDKMSILTFQKVPLTSCANQIKTIIKRMNK